MFHDWADFYIIVGGSAGALIGLMFVVATLTAGVERERVIPGGRIYITPIVFHFSIVVIVAAVSGVPNIPEVVAGVILAGCGAFGLVYSVVTTVRMYRLHWEYAPPDVSDKFFYGFFPALAYLGLAVAAAWVWVDARAAAYAVGVLMLTVLLIGIRNAWDLATAIVQDTRREDD